MKRIFVLALVLVMMLSCIPFSVSAETETEIWDGSIADSFASGSGTKEDPYVIMNGAQLAYLAQLVNNAEAGDENVVEGEWSGEYYACHDQQFVLGADIVLNDTSYEGWQAFANEWTPIGVITSEKIVVFAGSLDGRGHSISGLYIDSQDDYVGLFSCVTDKVEEMETIANLSIINADVTGNEYVGGLGGLIGYCNVVNCSFDGVVKAKNNAGGLVGVGRCNILACANYGEVTAEMCAGGIVGDYGIDAVAFSIEQCVNHGKIESTGRNAGGIIGLLNFTGAEEGTVAQISDCYNTGKILYGRIFGGGLFGGLNSETKNTFYVRNCYNIGDGNSTSENYSAICNAASSFVIFENCYYLEGSSILGVTQRNFASGILNDSDPEGVYALTADQMATQTAYDGFDFQSVWGFVDGNPVLQATHDHVFEFTPHEFENNHIAKCECGYFETQDHVLGDWEVVFDATCEDEGLRGRKCSECKAYGETEVIEAFGCLRGDVDNDGSITASDYLYLKRIYFGTTKLSQLDEPQNAKWRCDVEVNDKIEAMDYILLKRAYFGTYKIQ